MSERSLILAKFFVLLLIFKSLLSYFHYPGGMHG